MVLLGKYIGMQNFEKSEVENILMSLGVWDNCNWILNLGKHEDKEHCVL
jgi:hypothetical protein